MRTSRASRGAPTPAKPRKLYGKPALVSSLLRLAGLLGGGGSPERTGLVPSMRLLPLVGRPENSRDFVRRAGLSESSREFCHFAVIPVPLGLVDLGQGRFPV